MKSGRKTALRIGSVALIVALLILGLLFGLWDYSVSRWFHDMADTPYKYEEIFDSPGGTHRVTVWRSDAVWSFGPASVKVVASSGDKIEEYETKIGDDGGRGSVEVRWVDDDTARVTLSGKEQRDETVTAVFSPEVRLTTDQETTSKGV